MDILQAIILGIVQGLTEFIPISSTAHLVLASRWLDLYNGNAEQTTATMAVIQLGTLAAVFVYFASDIWAIASAFVRDHIGALRGKRGLRFSGTDGVRPIWLSEDAWTGWLIIFGSIPIGIVGYVFKDLIRGSGTKNLWVISFMLIAVGLLLALAETVGSQRKTMRNLGVWDAIVVGFAQVMALIPGASRSGSTIMAGLFAGQTRETAARFSFLLSIPAITASGLLELREALQILTTDSLTALIVGTFTAAVVGYLAIWFLMSYLKRNTTAIFIIYRIGLAAVILILLWQGYISAAIN